MKKRQVKVTNSLPETNESLTVKKPVLTLTIIVKMALMNGAWSVILPHIKALNDEDAIEGSMVADFWEAVDALRQYGKAKGVKELATAKKADLHHSLKLALNYIKDESGVSVNPFRRRLLALAAR